MVTREKELDLSKFIAYLYKKDGVMEIFYNNKLVHTTTLYNEEDAWYMFPFKGKMYDLNIFEGLGGLYLCDKTGKNTYQTGDFLDKIEIKEL